MVYTWILITFDLESYSLATAVVGTHLEITGLNQKGHEIFKFHITDRMLRRHSHLTGLKQDVKKSDVKKKRLSYFDRSNSGMKFTNDDFSDEISYDENTSD